MQTLMSLVGSLLPGGQIFLRGQTLGQRQRFQAAEPMLVIRITQILIARCLSPVYCSAKLFSPLNSAKNSLLLQCNGECKGASFPGFPENGAISIQ